MIPYMHVEKYANSPDENNCLDLNKRGCNTSFSPVLIVNNSKNLASTESSVGFVFCVGYEICTRARACTGQAARPWRQRLGGKGARVGAGGVSGTARLNTFKIVVQMIAQT